MNIPSIRSIPILALVLAILLGLAVGQASAQTTQFTYQGQLAETGVAANGSYDFQFALFDDPTGPNQLGSTISTSGVTVNGGIFTVNLDFGAQFSGPARYLQISVKQSANPGAYTVLHPRQPITSAPYSVRSLNATAADTATNSAQLGGFAANLFVLTSDPRMTDDRDPLAGSANYIQNTTGQQPSANFNIAGNGRASFFDAVTDYRIATSTVLTVRGSNNIFVGNGAGLSNAAGSNNAFVGASAGALNTSGSNNAFFGWLAGAHSTATNNSFFGANAGLANTSGAQNVFAGFNAGAANTTGNFNSFFGSNAGAANTTAINNAFFGQGAGFKNTVGHDNTLIGNGAGVNVLNGSSNTFVGSLAGQGNVGGASNTFVGVNAGVSNIGSSNNTFIGANAANSNLTGSGNTYIGSSTDGLVLATNATAIGQNAFAGQSNSLVLGSINGINGAVADTAVGIGTPTPEVAMHVRQSDPSSFGDVFPLLLESDNFGVGMEFRNEYKTNGHTWSITTEGNGNQIGQFKIKDTFFPTTTMTLTSAGSGNANLNIDGTIGLVLETGGHQSVCVNSGTSGILSTCSSSLRYKKDIERFSPGLALINKLHPISFRWRSDNEKDLGFGAEDVAKAEPLLVTHNAKGEVEGVKYDRITAVLVNAVKEQQAQIDSLQKIVMQQRYHAGHATTQAIVSLKYQVATLQAQRRRRAIRVPMAKPAATVANIPAALPGQAVILKSPDGATCKALSIDNTGAMVLASVPCP